MDYFYGKQVFRLTRLFRVARHSQHFQNVRGVDVVGFQVPCMSTGSGLMAVQLRSKNLKDGRRNRGYLVVVMKTWWVLNANY
jgi:hypothetical protein